MITSNTIRNIINCPTQNDQLYKNAFIHKSAIDDEFQESNERLEFIGDSVLNLIIAQYLYEKYPNENEGFLTRIRTKMVSGKTLSKIGAKLNFDQYIVMNEKGMRNEWNKNPRLLEDAFEAVIGSLYIDKGLDQCRLFIITNVVGFFTEDDLLEDTNYKDILMRYVQGIKLGLPDYKNTEDTNLIKISL